MFRSGQPIHLTKTLFLRGMEDLERGQGGERTTGKQLWGCWNVTTMHLEDNRNAVVKDLKSRKIQFCRVTEGHRVGMGEEEWGGYRIVFSGHEKSHTQGVGFVMTNEIQCLGRFRETMGTNITPIGNDQASSGSAKVCYSCGSVCPYECDWT